MRTGLCWGVIILLGGATFRVGAGADEPAVSLPEGVQAVWDATAADRQATATRERLCINGLWRWQPADSRSPQVPVGNWGYFKVPGCWPGITDYMQKDCQTLFAHPAWKSTRSGTIREAWYQREITVPGDWAGRRIQVSAESVNSLATLYLDGEPCGEIRFPGGEVDVTSKCRPGRTHVLSVRVAALPLQGVMLSYTDSASAREVPGSVARRGLCGDVFLTASPAGPRITDVKVNTSVRRKSVELDVAIDGLAAEESYQLRARIKHGDERVAEFASPAFQARDTQHGRIQLSEAWMPDRLWDIHTPSNTCELRLWLVDGAGATLDEALPVKFGFREFWIEGRDFLLNGTRLFLSAIPLDNAQIGASLANYAAARESLERLKSFGINFVYTHNYGCEPGSHLSFAEILQAADDVGMLVALSQPHFSHYEWQSPAADQDNGYARHAEFYVRVAQNHPSVVAYAMSHNATGYNEDMNPDMIDGIQNPRDEWSTRNAARALRAEAIVRQLDASRIVYHHSSGNLGAMHTSNFYPNFVPIQELSDWFEHWATAGVKPVFLCEYGAPFTWDWTLYRGWYKGEREFGSAQVPWEFCLAEWNAQFVGDKAYQISPMEQENLRWEARQYRAGRLWHRWDYPYEVGSRRFEERYPVFARYLTDNWRAFRTWGLSANSPWEHGHFWTLRNDVNRGRRELPVDWTRLQRPGFSPDYIDDRYERMDLAFERSDWLPTAAAQALLRNNGPLLAYLAGKPAAFTSKDHNFLAGETVEKQLVIINNSRETVHCDCQWGLNLPEAVVGVARVGIATGQQQRVPVRFTLPESLPAGTYELTARVRFSNQGVQDDSLAVHVLPRATPARGGGRTAVFDPPGETRAWLDRQGIPVDAVAADADLSAYETLIVGKAALTLSGPAPDIRRVRQGLKVVVFEQTAEVLEKRLGFRVAEYGLRWVFARIPDHPLLAGLSEESLRDWRGDATILPPRLTCELRPRHGPTVSWCDLPVTRLWRCGNRGNVASVLVEKPARGDFLPILDGGFGLQYGLLIEHRDGEGLVLFCQMDVTGRSESDPAAEQLARNILEYVAAWKPAVRREVRYVGESAGKAHLERLGLAPAAWGGTPPGPEALLVVGPGGGPVLANAGASLAPWLRSGGRVLAVGLGQQEAGALLPGQVEMREAEHIAAYFPPFGAGSLLAGVGPADVHNRDPRVLPLVASGASLFGNGVLAREPDGNAVFCQLVPWQFSPQGPANLKRTFRRTSFLLTRLLANLGAAASAPIVERFNTPVADAKAEKRWLEGLYLDEPEEWDDPYRFFRW